MRLTYFGHAAFQVETQGTTILVDPLLTDNPHTDTSPDELEPDVILLTHAHGDHWGDTPSIAERTGAFVIANYEIVQYLQQNHDHENAQPLNEGGALEFDWGRVEATSARHSSSFPDGTYGGTACGHVLDIEGTRIYNAGDTAPFAEMEWIGSERDVDLAILPIGGCLTMGIDGALRTADMVRPAQILPVHYDTFPSIETDLDEWNDRCTRAGHRSAEVGPGEVLEL